MITYLLAGAAILGTICGLMWWGTRIPMPHRNLTSKRLEALLDVLLQKGSTSGRLIIDVKGSDKFIQFEKYVDGSRQGVQLAFPKSPWSEDFYEGVRHVVRLRRLPFNIVMTSRDAPTTEFIIAELETDVQKAQELASTLLIDVLGADPIRSCVARLYGTVP